VLLERKRLFASSWSFYISVARSSYFNKGSSFVCCVLALYQGTTLEVAEKWRISPDVEFLRFFFGSLPRRMWAFY
jgi:hypothetical protein